MPEITIVNTSPLFYFHRLGLFELFNKLYGPITVPEAVKKELKEGQSQGEDVPKLEIYPWIKIRIAPVFALGKKLTCAPPFFSKPRKSCLRSVLNITLLIYIAITMIEEIKGYLKGMRGIYSKTVYTACPACPACPVKFMPMRSEAYFTGVAPADRTGVQFLSSEIPAQ